ncbi:MULTISPECIES: tRNA adenosine(34) deaminase TadA [Protofrankia]|nr:MULTISPECIES: tRNA adenosine(34) deaminase TadA [Protofrankia]
MGGLPHPGALDLTALMGAALAEAEQALATGDVPVGAVVVDADGTIIGRGRNAREAERDPTAHAEVVALRAAAARASTWRLSGTTLVVTLEPCAMCAGALIMARVDRLVYGAYDPRAGAAGSLWDTVRDPRLDHHTEVITGVREEECARLLTDFFVARRKPQPS